jgi:hypothetical protein
MVKIVGAGQGAKTTSADVIFYVSERSLIIELSDYTDADTGDGYTSPILVPQQCRATKAAFLKATKTLFLYGNASLSLTNEGELMFRLVSETDVAFRVSSRRGASRGWLLAWRLDQVENVFREFERRGAQAAEIAFSAAKKSEEASLPEQTALPFD